MDSGLQAKAKPLYGALGNTLEVIFLTPMGSQKETACRGIVPDILADVPFVRILGRHGSFKVRPCDLCDAKVRWSVLLHTH
jgi:hypothetical protein